MQVERPRNAASQETPAATKPSPPEKVHWLITSEPSGAVVVNSEGTMLGTTPFKAEQTPKEGRTIVRIRRDGYMEVELAMDQKADLAQHIQLVKIVNPKPSPAKPRGNAPPTHVPIFKPRSATPAAETPKTEADKGLSYED